MFLELSHCEGLMNKQPDITDATRNNLLTAFWKLYESKEVQDIRIKELTDIAGYHRATFYQYFTDIYDLLNKEEEDLINLIESMKDKNLPADASPDLLKSIANFYKSNGKRISLLIGPGGDSGFIEKLKNVTYKDFHFGEVVPDTPEVSVVFEFGLYGLLMSFNRWYQIKDELDVETFTEIARSIISHGIPHTLKSL